MSRLINADMLKLEYQNGTGITEEEKQFAYALIDKQPTAYDLDNVISTLENRKNIFKKLYEECSLFNPCLVQYRTQYEECVKCLDIVKRCGADAYE